MARSALDAATLVHLATDDLRCDPAHQLVAPNAIRSDALSLLFAAVRRGDITERVALERRLARGGAMGWRSLTVS